MSEWSQPGPGGPPDGGQDAERQRAQPAYPPPQGQPYPQAYPSPQAAYPAQPAYPAPTYASQQYPAPGYPQPAYAGYAPARTSPFPVSAFVLFIVSVVFLVATGIIGIPSAVLAVLAWRQNATDPAAARKRTTVGWVVFAVNFVIGVPLLIWFYVWALSNQ